jgi:hypothetical protein
MINEHLKFSRRKYSTRKTSNVFYIQWPPLRKQIYSLKHYTDLLGKYL